MGLLTSIRISVCFLNLWQCRGSTLELLYISFFQTHNRLFVTRCHLVYITSANETATLNNLTACQSWFQASAAVQMRSGVFWDVTQRRLVVCWRRFGTTCWSPYSRVKQAKKNLFGLFSSLTVWHLKMGPTGCPETSVRNYQFTLGKIPEKRRCQSISQL